MKRRARFSFEAFDQLCADALDEPETPHQFQTPVVTELAHLHPDYLSISEPAQPDNVVDLNANVTDLFPPDEAA